MSLSGKDLADIFGQAQLVGANWQVSGKMSWTSRGRTLSIDPILGIIVKDILGNTVYSLDMDGGVEGDFWSSLSLSPTQLDGSARSQHGVFLESFEHELNGWTFLSSSATPTFPPHGEAGGAVVRTTGSLQAVSSVKIPYDPSKTYRISARLREISSGTGSIGVVGLAADGVTKVNLSGSDSYSDPFYICCYNESLSGSWITYTGWFKGRTGSPSQGPATSPLNPKALHTDVRYISPIFSISDAEIDEISIDLADELSNSSIDFTDHVTGDTKPEDNATVGADWDVNLVNIPDDLFRTLVDTLDDISDGAEYGRVSLSALNESSLILLSAAVGDLDDLDAGSTNVHFTTTDEGKLDGIAAGATVGADWDVNLSNIPSDLFHKLVDSLDDITDGSTYGRVALTYMEAGRILLAECSNTGYDLDDVDDGTMYGRVYSNDLSSHHVRLEMCEGNLDDIANGVEYGRVAVTDISAGHILLKECDNTDYTLDDIDDGFSYGRVSQTYMEAGRIILDECTGDLDDIDDGSTYGRIYSNDLSSHHVRLEMCEGDLDDIDDGYYGKVLVTDIQAGHILLSKTVGSLDDIADGYYGKVLATDISSGSILLSSTVEDATYKKYTSTEQTKLSGVASGATVGADWDVNLSNIPSTLQTPSAQGLYLSASYLGFYDGGAWTAYIDNSGNFYFKGDADNSIDWNITEASTLTLKGGKIVASAYSTTSGASGARITLDPTDGLRAYDSGSVLTTEIDLFGRISTTDLWAIDDSAQLSLGAHVFGVQCDRTWFENADAQGFIFEHNKAGDSIIGATDLSVTNQNLCLGCATTSDSIEFGVAAISEGEAVFTKYAEFDPSAGLDLNSGLVYKIDGTQVVGPQEDYFGGPTGQTLDVDAEARYVINLIRVVLMNHGLMASS